MFGSNSKSINNHTVNAVVDGQDVVLERFVDDCGAVKFIGANDVEVIPDSWSPCCGGGSTVAPVSTTKCYNRFTPVSEPTTLAANPLNKGYVTQTLWTAAQFVQEANAGASDVDWHSLVETDTDGLPTVSGEYVQSNVTTITRNELTATGEFSRHEGRFYSPVIYPATAAGKTVAKAEIVDNYTGQTQADYSQLWLSQAGGDYLLDRNTMMLVSDNPDPGASLYTLDAAQRGEYVRFAYFNGDKGGASQFDLRMQLTYADGTTQKLPLTNFIAQPTGDIAGHTATTIEPLIYDSSTGVWTSGGEPAAVDSAADDLQEVACGNLPLTFNATTNGSSVVFANVSGGSGSGEEYSIDGGLTWQSSPTFDLSELPAREIIPVVRDGDGTLSARTDLATWSPCVSGAWSADFVTPNVNDTSYDDAADRGFTIDYSVPVGSEQLEAANNSAGLQWTFSEAAATAQDNSYIYLGRSTTNVENFARASLTPLLGTPANGEKYTVAFNPFNNYHGAANTTTTFTARIIDDVTSNTLGSKEYAWTGNTAVNLTNQSFDFVSNGNPVTIEYVTTNDNIAAADAAGHYVRIDNVRIFKGNYSDSTHHAKIVSGNRIFFRGVEGGAVYTSDAHSYEQDVTVTPKFNFTPYGTLTDDDNLTLQYRVAGGAWVTMLDHSGPFDAANKIYLSPFYYDKNVDLAANETLEYRALVTGTGANNRGYLFTENSDVVRC